MTNGGDGLDRVERILREMAARQQYHDEAFERHDAEMKEIRADIKELTHAISIDAENIRALARIAELHHERSNNIEGGRQA